MNQTKNAHAFGVIANDDKAREAMTEALKEALRLCDSLSLKIGQTTKDLVQMMRSISVTERVQGKSYGEASPETGYGPTHTKNVHHNNDKFLKSFTFQRQLRDTVYDLQKGRTGSIPIQEIVQNYNSRYGTKVNEAEARKELCRMSDTAAFGIRQIRGDDDRFFVESIRDNAVETEDAVAFAKNAAYKICGLSRIQRKHVQAEVSERKDIPFARGSALAADRRTFSINNVAPFTNRYAKLQALIFAAGDDGIDYDEVISLVKELVDLSKHKPGDRIYTLSWMSAYDIGDANEGE